MAKAPSALATKIPTYTIDDDEGRFIRNATGRAYRLMDQDGDVLIEMCGSPYRIESDQPGEHRLMVEAQFGWTEQYAYVEGGEPTTMSRQMVAHQLGDEFLRDIALPMHVARDVARWYRLPLSANVYGCDGTAMTCMESESQ